MAKLINRFNRISKIQSKTGVFQMQKQISTKRHSTIVNNFRAYIGNFVYNLFLTEIFFAIYCVTKLEATHATTFQNVR